MFHIILRLLNLLPFQISPTLVSHSIMFPDSTSSGGSPLPLSSLHPWPFLLGYEKSTLASRTGCQNSQDTSTDSLFQGTARQNKATGAIFTRCNCKCLFGSRDQTPTCQSVQAPHSPLKPMVLVQNIQAALTSTMPTCRHQCQHPASQVICTFSSHFI